jgi:hypothetical protein
MKSSIFWDVTQCNQVEIKRCFEATYFRLLQGGKVTTREEHEAGDCSMQVCLHILFDPEDRGDIPPKHLSKFTGPHGVVPQEGESLISTPDFFEVYLTTFFSMEAI